MDKIKLRVWSSIVVIATILTFLLVLSPSTSASAYQTRSATPTVIRPTPATRALEITPSPSPTAVDRSQPGSTDGIALMSFIIVLIIIIPLLLQRALWGK